MSNKISMFKKILPLLLSTVLSIPAQAAFTLNGTRFIYDEGKKSITFEVTNNAKDTYGGQVWVDNISLSKNDVFIVPSPPFFKIKPGNKQVTRLMIVSDDVPKDRESLFMLNVQEVPPKPKSSEGNVIAVAINTKVKLLYRPKMLAAGRKDAEKELTFVNRDGNMWIKNPTPYYFAVTKVKNNDKEIILDKDVSRALVQLSPFSEINMQIRSMSGNISVDSINDWGGVENYAIK